MTTGKKESVRIIDCDKRHYSTVFFTCIEVELWAGSTPIFFSKSGKTAPRQMLLNTISMSADVTAIVSANGVWKTMARKKPAKLKMALRAPAIFNSRNRNCF